MTVNDGYGFRKGEVVFIQHAEGLLQLPVEQWGLDYVGRVLSLPDTFVVQSSDGTIIIPLSAFRTALRDHRRNDRGAREAWYAVRWDGPNAMLELFPLSPDAVGHMVAMRLAENDISHSEFRWVSTARDRSAGFPSVIVTLEASWEERIEVLIEIAYGVWNPRTLIHHSGPNSEPVAWSIQIIEEVVTFQPFMLDDSKPYHTRYTHK